MRMHIAIAVALLATASMSLAQDTATLTISGTVENNTRISAAAQAGHNSLNIEDGETRKVVAVVNERSNKRSGYTVTLQSQNAGSGTRAYLKGTGGNTDEVDYTITYNGTDVTLSGGEAVITNAGGRTDGTGVNKNLAVTIAASWVNTDTYADTLTLTIAAK